MNGITQNQATPGQIKQINRLASDAIEKVVAELGLDKPGAQRVIEHGDEFVETVRIAALASLNDLSASDRFKDEEVKSTFGYLSGYKKPKDITEQTNILRQIFPQLGNACEKIVAGELPKGAEGWFTIPKWETIASTYGEAVQKVFNAIKKSRYGKFYNYHEGELGENQLRQSARATAMFQKLALEQKDRDILVVPAQFGLRHRGRSVRRVREVLLGNEFGLGAFACGIMILTHPERLCDYKDLWIDCAGDEFAPVANGEFSCAPYFLFNDDGVWFDAGDLSGVEGRSGTASGFLLH